MSLNPKKYEYALDDHFGILKKNPKNWIFGKDNTGDITNKNVITSLTKEKYDLITSDAGLGDYKD